MAQNRSESPPPPAALIDDDERTWRMEIAEKAIRMQTEAGYEFDARCRRLLERFVDGDLDFDQLKREIVRPYLH